MAGVQLHDIFLFNVIVMSFLQILGILSRRKQEEMKSRNQDFKAAPAWSISSGQMESGPGALPGFKC